MFKYLFTTFYGNNTFDPTKFHKHFQIKLNGNKNAQCAKIFVTEYNGNGQYTLLKNYKNSLNRIIIIIIYHKTVNDKTGYWY